MKPKIIHRYILFTLFSLCAIYSYSSIIISSKESRADEVIFTLTGTNISISLADFLRLKPSEFKKQTGHKLSLKEVIVFKVTQKRIKKIIRKDGTVDMLAYKKIFDEPFKFHWGGFLLGLLVPVGFILTLFFKDKNRKNRIKSAIYVMLLVLAIGATLLVLSSLAK